MFSVLLLDSFSDHLPTLQDLKQKADCITLMKMCSPYAGTFLALSRTVPTGLSWHWDCVFCVNGFLLTESMLHLHHAREPLGKEPNLSRPEAMRDRASYGLCPLDIVQGPSWKEALLGCPLSIGRVQGTKLPLGYSWANMDKTSSGLKMGHHGKRRFSVVHQV